MFSLETVIITKLKIASIQIDFFNGIIKNIIGFAVSTLATKGRFFLVETLKILKDF